MKMSIALLQNRIFIVFTLIIISAFSGWQIRSWYQSSIDLAILEASQDNIKQFQKIESNISITLENKLQDIQNNAKTIYKYTEKIVERPVYSNDCIDTTGLQYVNSLFQNNSAELTDEMSDVFNSDAGFEWKGKDTGSN